MAGFQFPGAFPGLDPSQGLGGGGLPGTPPGMPSLMPPGFGEGGGLGGGLGGALDNLPGFGGAPGGIPMPGGGGAPGAGGAKQMLPPGLIQKVLGLNKSNPEMERIKRQRQLADMLRTSAKSQMSGTQAGNVYKAPTLGNAAANIFSNYVANRQDQGADASGAALGQQEADAGGMTMEQLQQMLRAQRGQQ